MTTATYVTPKINLARLGLRTSGSVSHSESNVNIFWCRRVTKRYPAGEYCEIKKVVKNQGCQESTMYLGRVALID